MSIGVGRTYRLCAVSEAPIWVPYKATHASNAVYKCQPLPTLLPLQCGPLPSSPDRCTYVRNATGCAPVGRVNYLELPYCLTPNRPWLGEIGMGCCAMALFMAMSIAADDLYAPFCVGTCRCLVSGLHAFDGCFGALGSKLVLAFRACKCSLS